MRTKAAPAQGRTEDLHAYLTPAGIRALRLLVLQQQNREPAGPLGNQSILIDTLITTFATAARSVEEGESLDAEAAFGSAFGDLWRKMHP